MPPAPDQKGALSASSLKQRFFAFQLLFPELHQNSHKFLNFLDGSFFTQAAKKTSLVFQVLLVDPPGDE